MFRLVVRIFAVVGFISQVAAQLVPTGIPVSSADAKAIDSITSGTTECSCSCCKVTSRTASQMVSGVSTACSLIATDLDGNPSDTCPASCANTDFTSTVVTSDSGSVEYARFCLMNCLPPQTNNHIGSTCRKVTTEEQAKLLTSGGNGKDPATILQPATEAPPEELVDPNAAPEAPQLADDKALTDAEKAAAAAAAAALLKKGKGADEKEMKKEKETGAMLAEAAGKEATAAGMEARMTEAEASSAQALSQASSSIDAAKNGALMVNAAKAQVQAAEVRADIYAHSAAKAAAKAQAEFKAIEDIPEKVAALAADEAKKIIQGEVNEAASSIAAVKARLAGPALPVPLAEAAVRAAKPYYDVMQKAISTGSLYEASAHSLQDQAQELQANSRNMASQAVAYQMAGDGVTAQSMMAQARGLMVEAQAKGAQSGTDYAVAEGVRKSVPNYQANAAAASARATSLANPGGQPPPATAPTFLQVSSHTSYS